MNPIKNNLAKINLKVVIILLTLIILAGFASFAYKFYFKRNITENKEDQFPAIKIALVNGCGYQGVAANISEAISNKNIDVIQIANARKFIYKESIIVVKVNDQNELERLKEMTGINQVIYALNDSSPVPFIIIAGKDYQKYFQKKGN